MSYESEQLRSALQAHLFREQGNLNMVLARLDSLELFMLKAEPFIKAFELIDPPTKKSP